MSELVGLVMVWLGGALCGTIYTAIWFAHRAKARGYYTQADVNDLWKRVRHYDFSPASVDTRPEGGDAPKIVAPFTSGAVPERQTPQPHPKGQTRSNKSRPVT